MSSTNASLAPGKQSPRRFGSRASAYAVGDSAGRYTSEQSLRSIAWLEYGGPQSAQKGFQAGLSDLPIRHDCVE